MATLTVRNLDEAVKKRLRIQAALHGKSMEAEARDILTKGTLMSDSNESLAKRISQIVKPIGGITVDQPKRMDDSEDRIPAFEEEN